MKNSFYKAIIDNSPIGYICCKVLRNRNGEPCDYRLIDVNKTMGKLLGVEENRIIGKKVSQTIDIGMSISLNNLFNFIINNKYSDELDYPYQEQCYKVKLYYLDENQMIVSLSAKPKIYHSKSETYDIFEVVDRFRMLFDNAGVGIAYYTVEGDVIWYNKIAAKYLNGHPEEFKGKNVYDIFREEDAKELMRRFDVAVQTGEMKVYEKDIELPAGRIFFKSSYNCIYDDNDEPLGIQIISNNITNLKNIEQSLKESEEKFRLLYEDAPLGYQSLDIDGNIVDVNNTWLETLGYMRHEVIGRWFGDFLEENDIINFQRDFQRFKKNGRMFSIYKMLNKYREIIVVNLTGKINYDKNGAFRQTYSLLKNITENIEADRKLIQSEKRYRAIFEKADLGIYNLSLDGNIINANKKFCDILGISNNEIGNYSYLDITHEDDIDKSKDAFSKLKSGQVDSMHIEKRYIRKDKTIVNVILSCTLINDIQGNPLYTVNTIEDITDRKKAEEESKQFRTISDRAMIGNAITDLDGNVQYVNEYFTKAHGLIKDEVIGQSYTIFHSEQQMKAIKVKMDNFLQTGLLNPVEIWHTHKDGTEFPMLMSGIALKDDKGTPKYMVVNAINTTEIKKLEEENIVMEAHLRNQQKLEAIGTLAGGVAHEINNPINGIMNYSQLIYDSCEEDCDNKEFANEIIHETNRVATIVKNLLQFSRQEKQSYSKAKINDIINQTLSLIKTIIRHDQIQLIIDISENLPSIKCRSQQIQQVLMNLLTNARDALNNRYSSYHDDKKLTLSCKVLDKEDSQWIRITVEDLGNGIPKELHDRIFNPFFTTKGRDEGTGLGLAISHGIIKEHKGSLTFDTQEGCYTRFYLDLPVDNGWSIEQYDD